MGRLLGAGIGSLVNIFGPEIVVLGGGFGTARANSSSTPHSRWRAVRRWRPPANDFASSTRSSAGRQG